MKRILLIFIILIGLGIHANAQSLQRNFYNDAKILVYIEKQDSQKYTGIAGKLVIKNISGQKLITNISYKCISYDRNENYLKEQMFYKEITLDPGKDTTERGYLPGGYYWCVDSFSVMDVSIVQNSQNTPPNNIRPQQTLTVPSWAQGIWYYGDAWIRITSTQLSFVDEKIYECTIINGYTVYFDTLTVTYISPNQISVGGSIYDTRDESRNLIFKKRKK